MKNLLKSIQKIQTDGLTPEVLATYSKSELQVVQGILAELAETGRSPTLDSLWEDDFEETPVTIDEFLDNEFYIGKVGKSIYPVWREDLSKVLSPYSSIIEFVLRGSIGSGKTTVAIAALLYKMYYILCLRNPQRFYGLADGSPIIFGLFNIYKYLAQATSYQYLITWMRDLSPYFRSMRIRDQRKQRRNIESDRQVLDLPKGLGIALGAQAINALGMNLYGGLLSEVEFGKDRSQTSEDLSQVADLYYAVRRRMDSRFMQRGGSNPGLLCLDSSAKSTEGFLAKHILDKSADPNTYVSSYALYEAKAHLYKGSKTFTVIVGDKLNRSYIYEDDKVPIREGAQTLKVPTEFLEAYRYDIDTAIRDISGVATYGKQLFFPRRDLLLSSLETSTPRKHPFSRQEVVLSLSDDTYIEDFVLRDEFLELFDKSNKLYRPKFFPFADRFVHVDLAKNKDCVGIAMTCVSESMSLVRYTPDGMPVNARDYKIFVDFILRVRAARGSEIDFSKIRRFLFFLMYSCRFKIRWLSYDSWQSTDSLQTFKKESMSSAQKGGLDVKELSIDRTPGPYRVAKSAWMEGRVDWYFYEPFFDEWTKLEDHSYEVPKVSPAIDHPPKGSKDTCDAFAGSVNGMLLSKGVQVTGSDAQEVLSRAKAYEKLAQVKKEDVREGEWINAKPPGNPLEALFTDDPDERSSR